MHELANTLAQVSQYIGSPATAQSAHAGQDLQGYINPSFFVHIGAMAAASPNAQFTFALTECDTVDGTYTAVAGTDMVTSPNAVDEASVSNGIFFTADSDNDSQIVRVTYKGSKRFVKVEVDVVDEPSATDIAIAFAAEPTLAPVTA